VEDVNAEIVRIRDNFLETMGIPLLAGRSVGREDSTNSPKVAVISESFAQQVFPNVNPLGQRFGFSALRPDTYEVVGIAADTKIRRLNDESPAAMYIPYVQSVPPQANLQIRTAGDPSAWISIIPLAIGNVDPNLAVFNLSTQAEQLSSNLNVFRIGAIVASGLGLLTLFLASIALYSILSNSVTQRTGEIGIRVALGAQRRDVVRLIAGQTSLLLIIGFASGLVASLFLTAALQRQLYQVSPGDPFATVSAMLVLTGISCLAGYIPIRRAMRIDPNEALHYE
jgi:putative ABC transport system permease protein